MPNYGRKQKAREKARLRALENDPSNMDSNSATPSSNNFEHQPEVLVAQKEQFPMPVPPKNLPAAKSNNKEPGSNGLSSSRWGPGPSLQPPNNKPAYASHRASAEVSHPKPEPFANAAQGSYHQSQGPSRLSGVESPLEPGAPEKITEVMHTVQGQASGSKELPTVEPPVAPPVAEHKASAYGHEGLQQGNVDEAIAESEAVADPTTSSSGEDLISHETNTFPDTSTSASARTNPNGVASDEMVIKKKNHYMRSKALQTQADTIMELRKQVETPLEKPLDKEAVKLIFDEIQARIYNENGLRDQLNSEIIATTAGFCGENLDALEETIEKLKKDDAFLRSIGDNVLTDVKERSDEFIMSALNLDANPQLYNKLSEIVSNKIPALVDKSLADFKARFEADLREFAKKEVSILVDGRLNEILNKAQKEAEVISELKSSMSKLESDLTLKFDLLMKEHKSEQDKELQGIREMKEELEKRFEKLEPKLETLSTFEAQLETLSDSNSKTGETLKSLESKVSTMDNSAALAKLDGEVKAMGLTTASLESKTSDNALSLRNLDADVKANLDSIDEIKSTVEVNTAALEKLDAMDKVITEQAEKIKQIEAQEKTLTDDLRGLGGSVREVKSDHTKDVEELNSEVAKLQSTPDRLEHLEGSVKVLVSEQEALRAKVEVKFPNDFKIKTDVAAEHKIQVAGRRVWPWLIFPTCVLAVIGILANLYLCPPPTGVTDTLTGTLAVPQATKQNPPIPIVFVPMCSAEEYIATTCTAGTYIATQPFGPVSILRKVDESARPASWWSFGSNLLSIVSRPQLPSINLPALTWVNQNSLETAAMVLVPPVASYLVSDGWFTVGNPS